MLAKKILLVEDDIDIRETMSKVLKYEGYEVLQAEHGAQAMEILLAGDSASPDVILLDLFMPIMNGIEFLDALDASSRSEIKKIPIVLITASGPNTHIDIGNRAAAVISKPIDLKSFLNLLKKILK